MFMVENSRYWDQFISQHHQHHFEALIMAQPSKITSNFVSDVHVLFFSSVLQLLTAGRNIQRQLIAIF
jgi:hypothetical protein